MCNTLHAKRAQSTPSPFHSGGENTVKSVENILTEEHAFIFMYRDSAIDKRDPFYIYIYMSMRIW